MSNDDEEEKALKDERNLNKLIALLTAGGHVAPSCLSVYNLYPRTVLQKATVMGLTDITRQLLKSVVFEARSGNTETVCLLLEYKADVHACGWGWGDDGKPDGALRIAAQYGHTEIVCTLLAHKADVHACGRDGLPENAMRWAAFYGHLSTVRVLLEHKADVHASDPDNYPDAALYWAARYNKVDMIDLLLGWGANIELVSSFYINQCLCHSTDSPIDNVSRCMRLGEQKLARLHNRFDLSQFQCVRGAHLRALESALGTCRDLSELVLLYV